MEAVEVKEIKKEIYDRLKKLNTSRCFACGTCASGCPIPGTEGMEGWDPRVAIRMINYGLIDEVVNSQFPWVCTGCGRCGWACPMGLDMVPIWGLMKALRPRETVPSVLQKGTEAVLSAGNNLSIPKPDYLQQMAELGKELADDCCPGFFIPVDKEGADNIFFPNSKEVGSDYMDQVWWWKIFYAAKENWTVPSENWEAVDWGLFSGNAEATMILAKRKMDMMRQFKVQTMIMPDCGGGSYGCRVGMKSCEFEDPSNKVSFLYLYDYLKGLLETGRIKVDKSVHAGKVFTWHDSCKHGRELMVHFGKAYFEEPRWILEQCVDNFVELFPTRENNYCCGAGGGNWPGPFEKQSAAHGRFKAEQIEASGADVIVVGCSNCRDMMMRRLPKYYPNNRKYEVKYIWQVIAEALVIEPWSAEEIAKAEAEATAQWEKLGVVMDEM